MTLLSVITIAIPLFANTHTQPRPAFESRLPFKQLIQDFGHSTRVRERMPRFMARESYARNVGVTLPTLGDWEIFVYFLRLSSNVKPKGYHLQT